jgi:predicted RNA-binding protein with PUA-like domain
VRNYQARNYMRDEMRVGDRVFFYHSNTKPPGIVGLMTVIETGIDDPTQFDPGSDYYDPKATPKNPIWQTVRLEFGQDCRPGLTLDQLREQFTAEELLILRRGNRLSIVPVAEPTAERLLTLLGVTEQ